MEINWKSMGGSGETIFHCFDLTVSEKLKLLLKVLKKNSYIVWNSNSLYQIPKSCLWKGFCWQEYVFCLLKILTQNYPAEWTSIGTQKYKFRFIKETIQKRYSMKWLRQRSKVTENTERFLTDSSFSFKKHLHFLIRS